MRPLIVTWSTALIALIAFGAWLWFAPLPKTQAEPAKTVVVQGKPVAVSTGPIAIDLVKAKQEEEDCPTSC